MNFNTFKKLLDWQGIPWDVYSNGQNVITVNVFVFVSFPRPKYELYKSFDLPTVTNMTPKDWSSFLDEYKLYNLFVP